MVYDFDEQLRHGKEGEKWLDSVLSSQFEIIEVSLNVELREGVDRRLIHRQTQVEFTAEYKADFRAAKSGNALVEIWSKWETRAPGWARKTLADFVLHSIPTTEEIRFVSPMLLRMYLPYWLTRYPVKEIPNKSWTTRGIAVPLREFESACVGKMERRQQTMEWALA